MSNIVKASQAAIEYTPEQINLVRSQIAPKATDPELQLFLYHCQRTGLDALSRQIYAIHRNVWNPERKCNEPKMTIQVSIDGFRVVAERSKLYAGQSEPEFIEEGGKIKLCKVRVYKFNPVTHERYEAAVGVAYWSEYAQTTKDGTLMGLWAKMPHVMLSKVAEAIALRRAFPQDLSGLYAAEEMNQADEVQDAIVIETVDELKEAIEGLENCDTLEALSAYKAKLANKITTNQQFKDAGLKKYNALKKPTVVTTAN
jgi:phage recombination protein Bet